MKLEELQEGERYLIEYDQSVYEMLIVEKGAKAVKMKDLVNRKGGWWTENDIQYYRILESLPKKQNA
jgi:hypothetical protein